MHAALSYLGTLPDTTVVYNGHEYTDGNVRFALSVVPDSKPLKRLDELVKANKVTTGLTTIGDEKEWNLFTQVESEAVRSASLVAMSARTV